jgi:hypothetical protein
MIKAKISILAFADSVLGIQLYDWQCRFMLAYEAGHQTAAACANFTGRTVDRLPDRGPLDHVLLPRSRVMYLSAISAQVRNQFFASLAQFQNRRTLAGWTWLETEVRSPSGSFMGCD